MDATKGISTPRTSRGLCLFMAVAGGLAQCAMEAQASPMGGRPGNWAAQELLVANSYETPALPASWNAFLSLGAEGWAMSRPPAFSIPVRLAVWQILDGDPAVAATNPMIDYLIWRRDLNTARFDRYHPFLGPRLPQLLVPPLKPPTEVPPGPEEVPPLTPPPPLNIPDPVPEPNGLVVATLIAACGLWWRRKSQRALAA